MKRIISCIALSVISLAIAIGSFLTNDVISYKTWIRENAPKAVESFDKHTRRAPDEKRPLLPDSKRGGHKQESQPEGSRSPMHPSQTQEKISH
jgi:hypothetical protein